MRTPAHRFAIAVALTAAACLLASRGGAGEKKGEKDGGNARAWKPFLPDEAYQELLKRAADNIEEALKDRPSEEAAKRAQFNALMMAAYSKSIRGGDEDKDARAVRQFALQLARWAPLKNKQSSARQLAWNLSKGKIKGAPGAKEFLNDPRDYVADLGDLMEHFKPKAKGGEGIAPALQSNPRLKGALNGIEAKLGMLAMKKLSEDKLKKEADELALLGYRAAVVGELTYLYTPKMKAKEWQDLSLEMRDAGIALAEAAKRGDAEAVHKASESLNSSCTRCHSDFRK